MIYFIATTVIFALISYVLLRKCFNYKRTIDSLKLKVSFDNTVPRRQYNLMATFLRQKKSKLSFDTKVELLNMWVALMLIFPREYTKYCSIEHEKIDKNNDTLTQAEHKKAIIEALEALAESDEVLVDDLTKVAHHLYFIIFD